MVAAKIKMVNLRIEITPSSKHPARMMSHLPRPFSGKSPSAGKWHNVLMAPSLPLQAARSRGQPCNNG
jgi:hypothetical protein